MDLIPLLPGVPGLVAVTVGRTPPAGDPNGPPFNLAAHSGPMKSAAADRRRAVCTHLGLDPDRLTACEQIHGGVVARVGPEQVGAGRADRLSSLRGADGLATDLPGVPLFVLSADCCPVVVADPVRRVLAVLHAGRKSTAAAIAAEAVRRLVADFGSRPADLVAAVGPSIGPCCYQVGEEIRGEFPDRPDLFTRRAEGLYLDLWSANAGQLTGAGVPAGSVRVTGVCTACSPQRFFSYRKEGAGCGLLGTLAAWVG